MPPAYRYDASAYREATERRLGYLAGVARNAERFAAQPALSEAGGANRSWTYAELWRDVEQLAGALAGRGVRPGETVVFQLFNGPEFALCWLAAMRLGAIPTPINFRLSAGETAHVLADSEPAAFVYDAELAASAAAALELSAHEPRWVAVVGEAGPAAGAAGPRDGTAGSATTAPSAAALSATAAPTAPAAPSDTTAPSAAAAPSDTTAAPTATAAAPTGATTAPTAAAVPFAEFLAAEAEPPPHPPGDAHAETTRLYTSGTTGMPKGVSLNDRVEVMSAHDVVMHFPLGPDDRTLNMTPWFHRGGLYSGGPNPVFYVGAEAVALRAFDPAAVLDLVAARALTFLVGAPTNLAMLAAEQGERPRDLSSLRGIVTMGAPLEREACLLYQEVLTPRIFNGYGTTESFWNTFLRPADLPAHAGSAGRACTDDDVVVARSDGSGPADPGDPVARDGEEVGEVLVRTPKAGYAYVNRPEETAARFRGGWFHTGDLASWDAEGFVTIVGRGDDMLISGGENVHPVQVEEVLNEHPGVADSVVIGLPDERWGELVVAYVVPAEDGLELAALDAHCRAHPMLADYKRPRAYRLVAELPMTATGKKMHFRVRETAITDAAADHLLRP